MNRALDVATSLAATLARGGVGVKVGPLGPRPEKPLELYEFEACPFCRKVREALTLLDLDALVLPCPKGGPRFREEVKRRGGKYQFPYLVDPNTGKEMYESDDIVAVSVRTLRRRSAARCCSRAARSRISRRGWLRRCGRASAPATARRARPKFRSSSGASRLRRSAGSRAKRSRASSCPTGCTTSARAARSGRPSSSDPAR